MNSRERESGCVETAETAGHLSASTDFIYAEDALER